MVLLTAVQGKTTSQGGEDVDSETQGGSEVCLVAHLLKMNLTFIGQLRHCVKHGVKSQCTLQP
jgi:hypothetical protein